MDGSGPVKFAIHTPQTDNAAHVTHALSLDLPEADPGGKRLSLVANGPSAQAFNFNALANWHHYPEASLIDTMAVNGALKLFTDRGMAPTYWICCDPQGTGDNVTTPIDFLSGELPTETIYLVASKCHPEVFARLEHHRVRVWHVSDQPTPNRQQVPCAVSVTLCAMMLAMRLGYRHIDTYGWDCCYSGQDHHAGQGDLSDTNERITIEVGQEPNIQFFESNATWCCETEDAVKIIPSLKWAGTEVVVHGPSMIGAILREYASNA